MNRRDMGQRVSRKKKGAKHKIPKVQILSPTGRSNHKVILVRGYLFDLSQSIPRYVSWSMGLFIGRVMRKVHLNLT